METVAHFDRRCLLLHPMSRPGVVGALIYSPSYEHHLPQTGVESLIRDPLSRLSWVGRLLGLTYAIGAEGVVVVVGES